MIATGRDEAVLGAVGADAVVPLGGEAEELETAIRRHFADGIDIVLDYLWGPSARSILVAGAEAAPDGVPIRFVQIGSAAGADITMPAAVLRSSAIEMKGSGLGSVALPRLVAAIDGVFHAAAGAGLTLDHRVIPLADIAATWTDEGRRTVYRTS